MVFDCLTILCESISFVLIGSCILDIVYVRKNIIYTLLFLIIATGYVELFNLFPLEERGSILVHGITFTYFLCVSGQCIKSLYAIVVSIVLITIFEMLLSVPVITINHYIVFDNQGLSLAMNTLTLILSFSVTYWKKLWQFVESIYYNFKNKIYLIVLILIVFLTYSFEVKKSEKFVLEDFVIFSLYFITILGISYLWQKESIKNVRERYEEEQLKIYNQAYNTILKDIQLRQHEFDNHLNNLAHLHLLYGDYESLVKGMMEYVGETRESFKSYKLLNTKQPAISGCLHMLFAKYEDLVADVKYSIEVKDISAFLPTINIIEIINSLCDNAFQALQILPEADRKIKIFIEENEEVLSINVLNTVDKVIKYKELMRFFNEGYSTKGENHGMGLCNVKNTLDRYKPGFSKT